MRKNSVKNTESENGISYEFRKMGVVMEDMNSKMDLLVECYSTLDKKIDLARAELKEDLNDFKLETRSNFKMVFSRLDGLDMFREETKNNFKTVFEYLSRIDDEIQDIKSEISEIRLILKKKSDLERVAVLEKRIQAIEKALMREKILQKQKAYV